MHKYSIYKDVKVHYIVSGTQKADVAPTIYLHGWEGSTQSFAFVADALDGQNILIDFPPFGKSGQLKQGWTLNDYAQCVKQILQENDVRGYDIVAHSFGGRVALLLACSSGVNKMVLTGCAGLRDRSIKTKIAVYSFKAKKLLCRCGLISKNSLLTQGSQDYLKLDSVMKATFNNIVNTDLRKILNYIENEVLLIWGENDDATPLKCGKIMHKKLKNSGLYIFKNGSHFCYLENAPAFISAVKLFLNK